MRQHIYLVSLVGLVACTLTEPDPDVSVDESELIVGRCQDVEFCSTNSPEIFHYGVWEMSASGAPNNEGMRIIGLQQGDFFYRLSVEGSRLFGKDAYGNYVLYDWQLIGARIYISYKGKQAAIVISDIGWVQEVAYPYNWVQSYVLDWSNVIANQLPRQYFAGELLESGSRPILDAPKSVCQPPRWTATDGSRPEWDETFGLYPYHSILFEGDRYDPTTKTVSPYPDDDWFNIGCGTHTLAKLRLTNSTIHTTLSGDWRYVQTALKLLSADYCGTGKPFTYSGEPLVWTNYFGMEYMDLNPSTTLEARWNENGAMCFNEPRLANTRNPQAAIDFPNLWYSIRAECASAGRRVRFCYDTNPANWSGEIATSANHDH